MFLINKINDLNYKFNIILKKKGIVSALKSTCKWFFIKIKLNFFDFNHKIMQRKIYLSNYLYKKFDGYIKYGPFQGLKIIEDDSWGGGSDKGGMMLGIYEKEVLDEIISIINRNNIKFFIDIGAADGYYGIGFVFKNFFDHAYLFDISEKSQLIIRKNAEANNISHKISIKGEVKESLKEHLSIEKINNSLILMDIEGSEFNLLSEQFLYEIQNSYVIVELHDHFVTDGKEKLNKLIINCQSYFHTKIIQCGSRDTSNFEELNNFRDNDRWLLCSEGRGSKGHWLVLSPK